MVHSALLLLLALLAGSFSSVYGACGQTVLSENFDRFNGGIQFLSDLKLDGKDLWPKKNSRKSSNGKTLDSGFISGIGLQRLQLGNGELKIKHLNAGVHPFVESLVTPQARSLSIQNHVGMN